MRFLGVVIGWLWRLGRTEFERQMEYPARNMLVAVPANLLAGPVDRQCPARCIASQSQHQVDCCHAVVLSLLEIISSPIFSS